MQTEISDCFFDKCCFCLEEGKPLHNFVKEHKNLFSKHLNLIIKWDSSIIPVICPACVDFLHEVQSFREMVISSQRQLLDRVMIQEGSEYGSDIELNEDEEQNRNNEDCQTSGHSRELSGKQANIPSPEAMELGESPIFIMDETVTIFEPNQNVDGIPFELDDGEASSDKNYAPSSETSDDEDYDLECLDGSDKATNTAVKEKKIKSEIHFEITNKDAIEKNEGKSKRDETFKRKRIRPSNFCFYCETLVLNYARHLVRHHIAEPEVQSALSYPKNSLRRKKAFSDLRKKGNFVVNTKECIRPVKKSRFKDKSDYLPCKKCLGFYSRKQLWRHMKKCDNTFSSKAQVHAQNFLVSLDKSDKDLFDKVFSRMNPDKTSLVAKTDKLICAYGAQYLRAHPEEHYATLVSRKMRELAKLLTEMTKLQPDITNLEQALKPQYYDTLVHATKIVARFNEDKQQFDAPTYAMNIATSLKQCCSIALLECCEKEAVIELETLTKLITENWKHDISGQAAADLDVKFFNKTTIVPLAADVKLFNDYLLEVSKQTSETLIKSGQNLNIQAFNNLLEAIFCRVVLLNRRRLSEVQRLKLSDYIEQDKYVEIDKDLATTEKILVDNMKRVVIRGKTGTDVPVLFSTDIQNDIKIILSVRDMYIEDNNLLFVKAGGANVGCDFCGFKVLKKYAKACGAKHFQALTSTSLRKVLATITQIFSMTESELKLLVTYIGQKLRVHIDNFHLSNDPYQTAKISKLLLLTEGGQAEKYQGKTLDEIELNMDEEVIGDEIDNRENVEFELETGPSHNKDTQQNLNTSQNLNLITQAPRLESNDKTRPNIKENKRRTLVPWTAEQKNVVTDFFEYHIKYNKAPKRAECEELKAKHPTLLDNKDWLKIKVFIQNTYTKK